MKKFLLGCFLLLSVKFIYPANVDVYGTMRLDAWWIRSERFYPGTPDTIIGIDTTMGKDSIPVTTGSILPQGKLGFKFQHNNLTGVVEMGIHYRIYKSLLVKGKDDRELLKSKQEMPFLRKWYVDWAINEIVTFSIGQNYMPSNLLTSKQEFYGGNSFVNSGCLYTGRQPNVQVQVHDPNNIIDFRLGAARSDTFSIRSNDAKDEVKYQCETKLPKFDASFGVNFEKNWFGVRFKCAGGYQKYRFLGINIVEPADEGWQTIESYVIGATSALKFGPVTITENGFYGQNLAAHGVAVGDAFRFWTNSYYSMVFYPIFYSDTLDKKILNGNAFESNTILNVMPWEFLYWEGAFAYITGTHEYRPYSNLWSPQYHWYFQTTGKIMENLKITGEIGQYVFGCFYGGGRYFYWGTALEFEF
jgi:hypothetical protein